MSRDMELADEAVQRGVELLDDKVPGWIHNIIIDDFNINSCYNCVVGQVMGKYDVENLEKLDAMNEPWYFGFVYSDKYSSEVLQVAWLAYFETVGLVPSEEEEDEDEDEDEDR